jgi:3-oxoacyl-[acyl-carrier protein] reductase
MTCEGRVALVTGSAGSGMGRSIALTLSRQGARVVLNYRTSAESAQALLAHIVGRGGEAIAVQADVFEVEGCRKLVEAAWERFGQVDICVVGPGGAWHQEPIDRLDAPAALDDVRREIAPIYYLMPLVLPGMYQRQWGRFIGIALNPAKLPPAYAYNVGKGARTQALLLAQDEAWRNGVTVNVIAPAPVPEIPSLGEAVEQCDHGPAWQARATISPQDVAEGVAFLCSEAGRFVSGCVLPYTFVAR